jgi:hypothetical protein
MPPQLSIKIEIMRVGSDLSSRFFPRTTKAKLVGNLTDVQIRKWIKGGQPVTRADAGGLTFTLA